MLKKKHPTTGPGSYITGFILSAVLFVVATLLVESHAASTLVLAASIGVLALLLLIVQTRCFFHLNMKNEEGRWDFMTFLFTIMIILIVVAGNLWIMYNLNYNMMH